MAKRSRVEHAEEHRHPAVLVRDDREINPRVLCLVDVGDPALMVFGTVDAQTDHLGVALAPLSMELCGRAELGAAYRREVCRMREQNAPGVADELVEVDPAHAAVGGEVRDGVTDVNIALLVELLLRLGEAAIRSYILELERPV